MEHFGEIGKLLPQIDAEGEAPAPALAWARGNGVHFCTLGNFRVAHQSRRPRPGPGSAQPNASESARESRAPGNPKFLNFWRKGRGANRAVSAAGGLVGTGGKYPGWHFPVCMNGRVFAAGFPKRLSKPPFSPMVREVAVPGCSDLSQPGGALRTATPYS